MPLEPPPGPPPELAELIARLAKNVTNRYYKNETIHLDGYNFTNCCFNNCILITNTGAFSLKSCALLANCTIQYGPNAVRLIRLWNVL